MTAPTHAAIAAPRSFDRPPNAHHGAERDAAVAAHPASGTTGRARREALLADLLEQAYLFDDPEAYEAGVRDAYERFVVASG